MNNLNERYRRQIILEGFGEEGQRKLREASVLVIGAGGLGSPCIQYLAGAGIGTLGIMDNDVVSLSNLHRQVIHPEAHEGMNKAESAKLFVERLNPDVNVKAMPFAVTPENITEIISDYDFIVSAVDSFEIKFLINDACVLAGKPFSHGGVLAFEGQALTYVPGKGPCYRCIAEEIPKNGEVPTSAEIGVAGPAAGVIGTVQAMEAVKYFTGTGELLTGKLFTFDTGTMKSRLLKISKPSRSCRVCGENADIKNVLLNAEEYRGC